VHWIHELLSISTMDACQVISQVAESPVSNVVELQRAADAHRTPPDTPSVFDKGPA
jgi:hypothetical protein